MKIKIICNLVHSFPFRAISIFRTLVARIDFLNKLNCSIFQSTENGHIHFCNTQSKTARLIQIYLIINSCMWWNACRLYVLLINRFMHTIMIWRLKNQHGNMFILKMKLKYKHNFRRLYDQSSLHWKISLLKDIVSKIVWEAYFWNLLTQCTYKTKKIGASVFPLSNNIFNLPFLHCHDSYRECSGKQKTIWFLFTIFS